MRTIKTMNNGRYIELSDFYWNTTLWIEWKNESIHIQNYQKSDFAKNYKIKEDNRDFYYKIQGNTIHCKDFETIKKDIIAEDSIWILFIHKLVDNMQPKTK